VQKDRFRSQFEGDAIDVVWRGRGLSLPKSKLGHAPGQCAAISINKAAQLFISNLSNVVINQPIDQPNTISVGLFLCVLS